MNQHRIISLGNSCSIAKQLQLHNLKQETMPFDWVRTPEFNSIVQLLRSNFKHYLDPKMLEFQKDSSKFFNEDSPDDKSHIAAIYHHTLYNIGFYHDFSINDKIPFLTQFKHFKQKHQRRINRLHMTLSTESSVTFIRDELKHNKLKIETIQEFMQYIIIKYPYLKFKLILIIHNPKKHPLHILKYKHPNLIIIQDTKQYGGWDRPNLDWKQIFKNQ